MTDVEGNKGVSRTQPVEDGAVLSFEFRAWADDPSKERLDRGHYGPCAVYLKKVDSAVDDTATGGGWFKIFDHGYDASTKRWCTDELIDNNGLFNVKLPKGLEGGDYLARPEILALHNANTGDPQPYTGCAQIFLKSSGNLGPEKTVSIPGHLNYNEEGTKWDIYNNDNSKYPIPGPAVAKLVAKADSASTASTGQTDGLKPADCILENANWCGKEVPSYTDETGCWAASQACWDQNKVCWSSAPPTGGSGCKLWDAKCTGIQDACSAKNFNGPPNKGKVLTAEKKAIDVGLILGGGAVDSPAPAPATSKTEKAESKTDAPVPAKETPAGEEEDEPKPEAPASSPAQTTTAAPQAPKPTSAAPQAPKPTQDNSYPVKPAPSAAPAPEKEEPEKDTEPIAKPSSVVTAAPSAPKPTKGPACVPGGVCITVTEIEVVTQTVYVTASAGYKRGVESFRARRRMRAHRA
jgi:hypothetical protein